MLGLVFPHIVQLLSTELDGLNTARVGEAGGKMQRKTSCCL